MRKLEEEKQKYTEAGFMVSLIDNTSDNDNFDECLLDIIKNHIK